MVLCADRGWQGIQSRPYDVESLLSAFETMEKGARAVLLHGGGAAPFLTWHQRSRAARWIRGCAF